MLKNIENINITKLSTNGNIDQLKFENIKITYFYYSISFLIWIVIGMCIEADIFIYLCGFSIVEYFISKKFNWIINPNKKNILVAKILFIINSILISIPILYHFSKYVEK